MRDERPSRIACKVALNLLTLGAIQELADVLIAGFVVGASGEHQRVQGGTLKLLQMDRAVGKKWLPHDRTQQTQYRCTMS